MYRDNFPSPLYIRTPKKFFSLPPTVQPCCLLRFFGHPSVNVNTSAPCALEALVHAFGTIFQLKLYCYLSIPLTSAHVACGNHICHTCSRALFSHVQCYS